MKNKKGFALTVFFYSNFPIDYRDEENTFTNENEAKILVPVAGPSGEVNLKELALLTHLVKLRWSCLQMILPDIRKCSKSDRIMGANRYSCCKSLGAIT